MVSENPIVIGLGFASLDVLLRVEEMPTWEDHSRMQSVALDGGGPAATAIVAVSRLGVRAGLIGTAGSDEAGRLKLKTLTDAGVDTSRFAIRPGPERQVVIVYVHSETGERIFTLPESYEGAELRITDLDRDYITAAQCLHLDGFHEEAALQAAKWMREAGKWVILDGHSTQDSVGQSLRELVAYTDVLIGGSGFVEALTGVSGRWEAGEEALKMGPRIVIQTEGEGGCYTFAAGEAFHTPAFDVDVVDTTGAGDVFHGAYIVGLLAGWTHRQIALFASATAAMKCRSLGGRAGIPRRADVLTFLRERSIDW